MQRFPFIFALTAFWILASCRSSSYEDLCGIVLYDCSHGMSKEQKENVDLSTCPSRTLDEPETGKLFEIRDSTSRKRWEKIRN